MTEKNIFAYKLFLSLNISDFNLQPSPLKKGTPSFPATPPLKVEVLSSPPPLKTGWRLNLPNPPTPFLGSAHYVCFTLYSTVTIVEFQQINVGWVWEMVVLGNAPFFIYIQSKI